MRRATIRGVEVADRSVDPSADGARRIRVLQFVNSFDIGGTERHVANLVECHDPERFEFHLACFIREGLFLAAAAGIADRLTQYPIRRLYGLRTLRQQARFARDLRRHRIDVVHTYGFYPNCFALPPAWLAGVPVRIASIRDIGAAWSPAQRRVERWACRLADVVMVNAVAVQERLVAEGHAADDIVVIPNGIDVERIERADGADIRADLGLPEGVPLVGAISRLEPIKGLEYLVEAAPRVLARAPETRFLIVGDIVPQEEYRAYRQRLRERVAELDLEGRVLFTGFRDDVPEILDELAVSVLPSLTEGMPNAVLESMAAGVPVVASRVGGVPEIVDDGVTGLLVPAADPLALAEAILRVLDEPDLAGAMARRGRELVRERYSRQRMARDTENWYEGLLERRRGAAHRR